MADADVHVQVDDLVEAARNMTYDPYSNDPDPNRPVMYYDTEDLPDGSTDLAITILPSQLKDLLSQAAIRGIQATAQAIEAAWDIGKQGL